MLGTTYIRHDLAITFFLAFLDHNYIYVISSVLGAAKCSNIAILRYNLIF